MRVISLFLICAVLMVDLYLAERSATKRPEIFYGVAALMLFMALLLRP
jgi:hypothetical protein